MVKRIIKKVLCTTVITSILVCGFCTVCHARDFVFAYNNVIYNDWYYGYEKTGKKVTGEYVSRCSVLAIYNMVIAELFDVESNTAIFPTKEEARALNFEASNNVKKWYESRGRYHSIEEVKTGLYKPKKDDIFIRSDEKHSGIVTDNYIEGNTRVATVEGNTNNIKGDPIGYAVMEHNRALDSIAGFGDNLYTGGVLVNCALISSIFLNALLNTSNNHKIMNLPLAKEYDSANSFSINQLPDGVLYKLNINCKYYIGEKDDTLQVIKNEQDILLIRYNNELLDLGDIESGFNYASNDTNAYLIKDDNDYYLLIDKMYFSDCKYYHLYSLSNGKIELVEEESGRIDFVGYDYIIGYTDLGMVGYQRCEFKKVFKNGKFELDGEYKVVGRDNEYPFWHYYTLVKDLEYEEYNDRTKKYRKKVLKAGSKIRALSTDAKSYINIEVEDGRKGKVKVDKVEEIDRDFIVNGQLFMNYYFLDGTKYDYEVFNALPSY